VHTGREAKSISAERTFEADIADAAELERRLWPLCERVAGQLRKEELLTSAVVLKLKTARFRLRTRRRKLATPSDLAADLFSVGRDLLRKEATGERFRLIGIGSAELVAAAEHEENPDLFGHAERERAERIENTLAAVRRKFGRDAITLGRGLKDK
jgi:DNA polymerase-4